MRPYLELVFSFILKGGIFDGFLGSTAKWFRKMSASPFYSYWNRQTKAQRKLSMTIPLRACNSCVHCIHCKQEIIIQHMPDWILLEK